MLCLRKIILIYIYLFPCAIFAAGTKVNYFNIQNLNFSGYIDTSYNYLLRNHQFISGVNDRVNDLTQNGFTLQQAAATISILPPQGFGGLLNFFVGRDAYYIAPYGWDPYYGSQTLGFVVPYAYLQYATGAFTFLGGLFETLVGQESYDPTKDMHFSRSILDGYAEPGIFMGIRSFYTATDKFKLNLGLNNGWSGIRDTGRQLTIEAGGTYVFNSVFSLMVQGLSGEQRLLTKVARGPMGRRNFINLITTLNPTSFLTFVASGDYGVQHKAISSNGTIESTTWDGVAGYVNYKLNEKWRTALRGEVYADLDGYTTGVRQNWREVTLTLAYIPIKNAELRAETRRDFSNVNSFMNATGPGASNNQQSYALEGIYQF